MRVLLISTEFLPGPGGIGTHAYHLALELHRRDWEVKVLTPQDHTSAKEREEFNARQPFAIETFSSPGSVIGKNVSRLRTLVKTVIKWRPDVIVGSGKRALWLAAMVASWKKSPLMIVGHGTEFVRQSDFSQKITRRALQSADVVVSVSNYTANLIADIGAHPRHLVILPNGADGERFFADLDTTELRDQLGLNGKLIMLTVGNVSERKAHDVIIRAMPEILRQCPEASYLIVGLPIRQAELQQLAESLGVAERVQFTGTVPPESLPYYYNLCDLFVLVSREAANGDVEGYGIVVIEAAMCGRPAVVSQGSGLQEAVIDGVTGITVPVNSVEATAHAIINLFQDEDKRAEMSRQALARARQATWHNVAGEYHKLLCGLVK